jgi:ubiquinone/menaquinone biosynthesis C-methylase UbiE
VSGHRSTTTLFDAAIESAAVFNWVAAECAVTGHLLDGLAGFSTRDELVTRFGFHPDKRDALDALLRVLVNLGLAERRTSPDGTPVYRVREGAIERHSSLSGGIDRYAPNLQRLDPWYGERHVDLIRSSNRELLGDDLAFFRSASSGIRFARPYFPAWRANLLNPLYDFGRVLAVRALLDRGQRFLDLACGMGHGAQRIAELSKPGAEVVCVDISADMLGEARTQDYPGTSVRFIERDLNDGLPPLPAGRFDGVLFNGAFHFIEDKRARLAEIHRVLRPGGLLVLGHCFCRSGFEDEPMHDLYFSLVANPSWVVTFEQLRDLVAEAGFAEVDQYHRGSHSYLLAERPAGKPS